MGADEVELTKGRHQALLINSYWQRCIEAIATMDSAPGQNVGDGSEGGKQIRRKQWVVSLREGSSLNGSEHEGGTEGHAR